MPIATRVMAQSNPERDDRREGDGGEEVCCEFVVAGGGVGWITHAGPVLNGSPKFVWNVRSTLAPPQAEDRSR